ncbi:hypothetical protein B0H10DRAFT_1975260, partial [Mycena sp. CBHHK59/15]
LLCLFWWTKSTHLVCMHLSSLLSLSCLLLSGHPRFALTINGGPHGSFTVELECTISSQLPVDISLGLDWKTSVREWLITLGL